MRSLTLTTAVVAFSFALFASFAANAAITPINTDTIIASGQGYQLKEITYLSEDGNQRTVELYHINNVDGAMNAYLNAGLPYDELVAIQDEVDSWGGAWGSANATLPSARTASAADHQFVWVIDKRGASITTDAEAQAYINEFDLQSVVDQEMLVPDGDIKSSSSLRAAARLFGCRGWRQKSKHFNQNVDEEFSHSKTLGSGVATLTFEGNLDVDATIDMNLAYDYYRNFACIPYKFRFRQLDTTANYEAYGEFSLTGTLQKKLAGKDWKIAEPHIMDVWFAIGPVPVRVAMDLPITVGTGEISLTASGELGAYKPVHFKGDFQYRCDTSSCVKVRSNHQNLDRSFLSSIGAAASANATAKPYVHVAAKPYLYGTWFFYAQLGIKPSFPLELYGYYGNLCDDGNNDGQNELVSAALGTVAFEAGVTGEAKIFGQHILSPRYWQIWYKDLTMVDFLSPASSAFSAVLRPAVSADKWTVALPVSVRSCVASYVSRFPRDYTVVWGDGGATSQVNDLSSAKQLTHTYALAGTYPITVRYKNQILTTVNVTVGDDDWGGAW